jgi:hypothetical protein
VQHPTFIEAMKATSKSSAYYKPPSYLGLHTNLLKQSKVNISKHIVERMWNFIHKHGKTFCSNGWDNVARHPLLNVMFICPNGDVLLGAVNTLKECKDAHYICNALIGYIETIGMHNIVQICICNASNMQNVVNFLICHFPRV